jgi:hypothetical protein
MSAYFHFALPANLCWGDSTFLLDIRQITGSVNAEGI